MNVSVSVTTSGGRGASPSHQPPGVDSCLCLNLQSGRGDARAEGKSSAPRVGVVRRDEWLGRLARPQGTGTDVSAPVQVMPVLL